VKVALQPSQKIAKRSKTCYGIIFITSNTNLEKGGNKEVEMRKGRKGRKRVDTRGGRRRGQKGGYKGFILLQ